MKYLRRLPAMLLVIAVIVGVGFAWQQTPAASLVFEAKAAQGVAPGQPQGTGDPGHAGEAGTADEEGAVPGVPPPGMGTGAIDKDEEKAGAGGDQTWPDLASTGSLVYVAKVLGGILLIIVLFDAGSRHRRRARRSSATPSPSGSAAL